MKGIDYYMSLPYRFEVIPDTDEGGYVIRYPDLPGCLTSGGSLSKALEMAEDAKRNWLETALAEGIRIVEPRRDDEYSGQFKLRIPKSLHRSLAEHALSEGISMNQYCLYLLSQNNAMRSND